MYKFHKIDIIIVDFVDFGRWIAWQWNTKSRFKRFSNSPKLEFSMNCFNKSIKFCVVILLSSINSWIVKYKWNHHFETPFFTFSWALFKLSFQNDSSNFLQFIICSVIFWEYSDKVTPTCAFSSHSWHFVSNISKPVKNRAIGLVIEKEYIRLRTVSIDCKVGWFGHSESNSSIRFSNAFKISTQHFTSSIFESW